MIFLLRLADLIYYYGYVHNYGSGTVLGTLTTLAVTVAMGEPFIGAELHPVPPRGPVLGEPGWQQGTFSPLQRWAPSSLEVAQPSAVVGSPPPRHVLQHGSPG